MRLNAREPSRDGSSDVIHAQARDALSRGRLAEVEALCGTLLRLKSDDVGALNLLGQALLAAQRPSEASERFTEAVRLRPDAANLRFNLALACQALGEMGAAIEALRHAVRLEPEVAVLHAKLGQLLCAAGAPQEAVSVLRRALRLDPKALPAYLNLGQALIDVGEMVEAEKTLRSALFLNPNEPTANRLLGRIHQTKGEFTEAIERFQKSIALQPNQAAAYFALAYSKQMTSDDAALIEAMNRQLGRNGLGDTDGSLLSYAVGKSLDDLGDYDAAMDSFERANRICLSTAEAQRGPYRAEIERAKVDKIVELFPDAFDGGEGECRPIFIVGMIRSGTTLVEEILSRHPDVDAGGELKFWTENEARFLVELSEEGLAASAGWNREYEVEIGRISPGSRFVTDKMPLNYHALGLIHLAYPGAKIVHCLRSPLDTCLSIYMTPYCTPPEFAHDLDHIASAYAEYKRLMAHWKRILPEECLIEVRYEDLVGNQETSIRTLVESLGLEWDPACLETRATKRPIQTPSVWQARQPIYGSSVGRWKNYAHRIGALLDRLGGA
ncbi:MAG: sulfotransferase [Fimbriimonas sp.]|nr:sulfotransferase [Fimbriimonas sp.]